MTIVLALPLSGPSEVADAQVAFSDRRSHLGCGSAVWGVRLAQRGWRVTGTLTKVEWTNPHIYFYLDAKDEAGDRRDAERDHHPLTRCRQIQSAVEGFDRLDPSPTI